MAASTLSPLSPAACSRLATSLLERNDRANSLWEVTASGPSPQPDLVCGFDTVDDLLGLTLLDVRAIGLLVESRVNGEAGWAAIAQSTCGCVAVAVCGADGQITAAASSEVGGYLNDLARRIVGLSTPPEPTPPITAIQACWLSDVLDIASDPATSSQLLTWADLLRLHPLVGSYADEVAWLPEPDFVDTLHRIGSLLSWEAERLDVASGAPDCAGLLPHEAAWMDAGMFARWTLGSHRDVDELLDTCRLFLNFEHFERVLRAVKGGDH